MSILFAVIREIVIQRFLESQLAKSLHEIPNPSFWNVNPTAENFGEKPIFGSQNFEISPPKPRIWFSGSRQRLLKFICRVDFQDSSVANDRCRKRNYSVLCQPLLL